MARLRRERVVLAGGAWTAQSARWLGADLPIYPLRGQILALYAAPPPVRHVVFGNDVYVGPKADGIPVVAPPTNRPAMTTASPRKGWVGC